MTNPLDLSTPGPSLIDAWLATHRGIRMRSQVQNRILRPGALVYREGRVATDLVIVRRGVVKLQHQMDDGSNRVVRLISAGEEFGLESLVSVGYLHEAQALTHAEVELLSARHVREWALHDPVAHSQMLLRSWQHDRRQADFVITHLSTGSARSRMAKLMLFLGQREAPNPIPMPSRVDMGSLLGLTAETASRMVSTLRREGLIHQHPDGFRGDIDRLTDEAYGQAKSKSERQNLGDMDVLGLIRDNFVSQADQTA